jgi:hypothetical protein
VVCVIEGGVLLLFIALQVWFPPSLHMEIIATVITKIKTILSPKIRRSGRRPGLAEPRVRLTLGEPPLAPSSSSWLVGGSR